MTTPHQTTKNARSIVRDLRTRYVTARDRDGLFGLHFERLFDCDEDGALIARPAVYQSTGDTRGILLVDGPGGGKSSLVRRALKDHPLLQATTSSTRPLICVKTPSPATLKSLGLEVLRESGYPMEAGARERWNIWNLVRARLQELGTLVIWIDEAHDLFRTASRPEVTDILNTLKSLMQGEGAVIIVLTGIEQLWDIAKVDEQIARRFSKIMLPPVSPVTDGDRLWRQIERYCEDAGLEAPVRNDLVDRLIYGSRARFGRCLVQIVDAIEVALRERAGRLDIQHFAEAWAMQEGCVPGQNVFLSPRWSSIKLG